MESLKRPEFKTYRFNPWGRVCMTWNTFRDQCKADRIREHSKFINERPATGRRGGVFGEVPK